MPCAFRRDGTPRPSTFTARVIKLCMFLLLAALYHMQLVFSEPWTTGIHKKELDRLASCLIRIIVKPMDSIDEQCGRFGYVWDLRDSQ